MTMPIRSNMLPGMMNISAAAKNKTRSAAERFLPIYPATPAARKKVAQAVMAQEIKISVTVPMSRMDGR